MTDLAMEVGLSQSCTTRHLQALERRHVVCGVRDGKRVMYRLCHEEPALGSLLAWALNPEQGTPWRSLNGPREVEQGRAMVPRRAGKVTARRAARRSRGVPKTGHDGGEGAPPGGRTPPHEPDRLAMTETDRALGATDREPPATESTRPQRSPRYELEDYLL